jgi:hypothetical protein
MKVYWGSAGIAPRILDLGNRWRWVVSFTLRPLYPQERTPGTSWIGGWVGPGAGLYAVVKRKIPSPCRDSKPPPPHSPVRSSVLYRWATPAPIERDADIIFCISERFRGERHRLFQVLWRFHPEKSEKNTETAQRSRSFICDSNLVPPNITQEL